jgi:hypothetical protein
MFKLLCNVGFKYLCGAIICISGVQLFAVSCTLFYIAKSSVQLKKIIFKTFSYFYNRAV